MQLIPHGDRVLAQVVQEAEVLYGKIVVENNKPKGQKGVVIAVGEGKEGLPMHYKPGDEIMFSRVAGSSIEFQQKEYLLLRQDEIWGTIKR
jgi:chaperonin GroES